ncbi:MAG: hypothetical protein V3T61_11995 [Acidobacteriota bacterium]
MRVAVAIGTRGKGETFKDLLLMTGLAFHLLMGTSKWKSSFGMIELNLLERDLPIMTVLAIGTQLTSMNVFMAGYAAIIVEEICGGFLSGRSIRCAVTFSAFADVFVQAFQRIAGLTVFESLDVPTDHPKGFTLVLGMTGGTILRFETVKARLFLDPFLQILMACQASLGHNPFFRAVTKGAVAQSFVILVSRAQGTRREQCFEHLCSGRITDCDDPESH